jgi:hypothetical protein
MDIYYILHKDIDKVKWDNCVNNSINKLIYVESIYLDKVSENWDAIILNDYEAVMPLTWKKKLGIKYLYQPAFFQQGGIFCSHTLSAEVIESFISLASTHFKFAEITLNHLNTTINSNSFYTTSLRNNYILKLNSAYEKLTEKYALDVKQSLTRLSKFQLQYKQSDDYIAVIKQYKKLYKERLPSFVNKDYTNFEELCEFYYNQKKLVVRHVFDKDNLEILSSVLMLKDENRLYNIVSCIFPNGKKFLANYFLYDALINEFSDQNLIIDFEGSDVPGIAYFYEKFTKENEPYPYIKWNNLPAPIKLIKR